MAQERWSLQRPVLLIGLRNYLLNIQVLINYGLPFILYRISLSQLRKLMKRFAQMDGNKDGLVSSEDLARFLRMPDDARLQSVFSVLDKVLSQQDQSLKYFSITSCDRFCRIVRGESLS